MSSDVVVDTSALAALLFGEPEAEVVAHRLQGRRMLAPTLLGYELASVYLKKARQHPALARSLRSALGLFSRMGIHQVQVPTSELPDTARRTGLTTYDAAYLWLAQSTGAELVTLDATLEAAARKA